MIFIKKGSDISFGWDGKEKELKVIQDDDLIKNDGIIISDHYPVLQKLSINLGSSESNDKMKIVVIEYPPNSIIDDPDNKYAILVDAAGSAFDKDTGNTYSAAKFSEALYKHLGIYGKSHNLGKIDNGEAKINNELDLKDKLSILIHAVGPRGGIDYYNKLKNTIKAISVLLDKIKQTPEFKNSKFISLPLLSSGIYATYDLDGKVYITNYLTYIKTYLKKFNLLIHLQVGKVKSTKIDFAYLKSKFGQQFEFIKRSYLTYESPEETILPGVSGRKEIIIKPHH